MALSTIRNRIRKAQANTHAGEDLGIVAGLLSRGAYYDECTDEEKNAYCAYYGTEREALEEVNGFILGTLHFQLERKPKPPTEAQFRERVREVEELVQAMTDEYNTPEARAKREAEYQELQRIGAQRKAAYDRGESMDAYPLPWERKDTKQ